MKGYSALKINGVGSNFHKNFTSASNKFVALIHVIVVSLSLVRSVSKDTDPYFIPCFSKLSKASVRFTWFCLN